MDKNDFFREATIRICGNLEIEKALFSTLKFIRTFIPIDFMFMEYFDKNIKAMRTLAKVTPQSSEILDLVTPVSEKAQKEAAEKYSPTTTKVIYFKDPYKELLGKELLNFHKIEASSLLILVLESDNQPIGTIAIIQTGKEKLNEKQIEYLSLLKEPFTIALSNHRKHREITHLKELLADDNKYLHQQLRQISGEEIIGSNYGLKEVMQNVRQVANLDSPVLLLGETGVGKDVIANAIHYSSARNNNPFITMNCGAIPDTLIDSELFGYEKGAFTGAISQKRGRFERANNGTIFLDEIGELPLQAQVKLLRVLQNKEFERVGGTETIKLNIRIIAATNRDLNEMVLKKEFREDLWFRLNVFPIHIPPLRARKIDIPDLLHFFVESKCKELKIPNTPTVSSDTVNHLLTYDWPGNVRELQNIVERELILNPSGPLLFNNFRSFQTAKPSNLNPIEISKSEKLDEVIVRHIEETLAKTKGKIHGENGAAQLLGINASTLRNKMNKLGIKYRKNELYE